jgi:alpha-amylase
MVRTCELLNLADLDLGQEDVRAKVVAYLTDLVSLGVAGFRIDAAKHLYPEQIATILGQAPGEPYVFQEVIEGAGEPIVAAEYTHIGDVTEFRYGQDLGRAFRQGTISRLRDLNESNLLLPSTEAVVFVDNHDNQRGHGAGGDILMHEDGALYELAVVFMLAYPYGYPKVMSSYEFENSDQGPPALEDGATDPVYDPGEDEPDCFEGWVCEHRWGPIAGMVGFHNFTSPQFTLTDWWDNGGDQIAFGRGDAGFVVINRSEAELSQTFQTSMAPGAYCNVIEGTLVVEEDELSCSGPTITVDGSGQAEITVRGMRAAAIHVGAKME